MPKRMAHELRPWYMVQSSGGSASFLGSGCKECHFRDKYWWRHERHEHKTWSVRRVKEVGKEHVHTWQNRQTRREEMLTSAIHSPAATSFPVAMRRRKRRGVQHSPKPLAFSSYRSVIALSRAGKRVSNPLFGISGYSARLLTTLLPTFAFSTCRKGTSCRRSFLCLGPAWQGLKSTHLIHQSHSLLSLSP